MDIVLGFGRRFGLMIKPQKMLIPDFIFLALIMILLWLKLCKKDGVDLLLEGLCMGNP